MPDDLQDPDLAEAPGPALPVAVVVLIRESSVLLTRRPEGKHLEGFWEFPGGKIHAFETPEDAARREVREEVDLSIGKLVFLHLEEFRYPERTVALHFFLTRDFSGEPSPVEGQEVEWVDISELEAKRLPPANEEVLKLLAEQFA